MAVIGEPVLLIHKRDGSVVRRFASESEAARQLQRDRRGMVVAMRDRTLQPGPHIYRLERDWQGREDFRPNSHNRPVFVAYRGRVQWFEGTNAAVAALGLTHDYVFAHLAHKTKSRRGLYMRYAASTDDWRMLREDMMALARRNIVLENPLALGKPARDGRRAPFGESPE